MNAPISITFTDYAGLVDAFRALKDHIGLSNAAIERMCKLGSGNLDKLLGPSGLRAMGRDSFDDLAYVLCARFTVELDIDRAREMEGHWESRLASNVRSESNRVSKKVIDRAAPYVMRAKGRLGGLKSASLPTARQVAQKGGKARARKLTKQRRREIARKAGLASAAAVALRKVIAAQAICATLAPDNDSGCLLLERPQTTSAPAGARCQQA